MFRWYHNSAKCYIYLTDISTSGDRITQTSSPLDESAFKESQWFTRGWTLQELLAPKVAEFYSREGYFLGDRITLEDHIHDVTRIPVGALRGQPLTSFDISDRMKWTDGRQTTIDEDQAYCLLGIFEVFMPHMYGEGMENAFRRLRVEIASKGREPPMLTALTSGEKTEACLANLVPTNQVQFLGQVLSRSANTCDWIFKNRKFVSWHESRQSSLLVVTGKAGCGKSTLAANTMRFVAPARCSLNLFNEENSDPVVLFIFFQRSNQEAEKTATAALRTFSNQLVRQQPRLCRLLLKQHDFLSARGAFIWSWEKISSLMNELLRQANSDSPIYIVLDAIDECDSATRMKILDWANSLGSSSHFAPATTKVRPVINILVTGRPDGDITASLAAYPTIRVSIEDTIDDVRALIYSHTTELSQRRHLGAEISRKIINFLEQKANGMFLWVLLVLKELDRRDTRLTDETIASKLAQIPLTLYETYTSILHDCPPSRKQDMWKILRWLFYGKRSLSFAELEEGLCLELGITRWYDFSADVEFLCGSLIRMDGARGIRFVHQTARDFVGTLFKASGDVETADVEMKSRAANKSLATTCLQYLLEKPDLPKVMDILVRRDGPTEKQQISNILDQNLFLTYAVESWSFHINASGDPENTPSVDAMVRKLLSLPTHRGGIMALTYFINHHTILNVPVNATPLHLAAYFDFPWIVESYVAQDRVSVDVEYCTVGDSPLIWASEMGSAESVRVLLDSGANPNKHEYDSWSALHWAALHWAALHWAARNGHSDVARLLLEHGARLDHRDNRNLTTALEWATDREHWDVVALLKNWKGGETSQETGPSITGQRNIAFYTAPKTLGLPSLENYAALMLFSIFERVTFLR